MRGSVSMIDGHIDESKMTDKDIQMICEKIESLHTKILKSKFAEIVTKSEMLSLVFAVKELNRQKAELEVTRAYLHDNGLEWDLLSYSKRNSGEQMKKLKLCEDNCNFCNDKCTECANRVYEYYFKQQAEVERLKSMNQAKLDMIHDLRTELETAKAETERVYANLKAVLAERADAK